jgi:fatty acid desaturase
VPAGIWLAVRLIPAALLAEFRDAATRRERPRTWTAAIAIVALWLLAGFMLWRLGLAWVRP